MTGRRPPRQRPVAAPPPERPVGKPPHPRTPALVRDVGGNEPPSRFALRRPSLGDLFALFRDLPRPPRPAARLPVTRKGWTR
ncbi:MAG: hypothetical protein AB7P99_19825 [Vicinamibacterales bacterium]